ncbi:MAG: hypothetical protein E2O29_02190 [Deltaproteobacteria bacterium]|nr:MAG: hypothetical protein E2O29_02190 [Deltaproteobacteria bacterium]
MTENKDIPQKSNVSGPVESRCNGKLENGKYCKRSAGWRTDHAGTGFCRSHGGIGSVANKDLIWEEFPVSSREFFETFLNEACYPAQQDFVDKMLGTDPTKWSEKYSEGIALIGKGGGKDRTIAKIFTYCCYWLLCMKNPQKFLGLNDTDLTGPESAIDIGNVSLNARLAKDVFFKNFASMVKCCTIPGTKDNWFEKHGVSLKNDIQKREIIFPKGITAYSLDSVEYTGEGLNLLLVAYDEVGGFEPKKASELHQALTTTQKTRFGGKRKTLMFSYKRDDNDFMMIRYAESENEEKTYRVKAATWEWNPKRTKEDFLDDYIRNPEDAQRIYECEGTTAEGGYFKYKSRITESINANRVNPVIGDHISTDDILGLRFKDFFRPLRGQQYFVHVDLAKGKESGDYCGLALGHALRNQNVKLSESYIQDLAKAEGFQISGLTGQKQTSVIIDLILQIKARPGQEIIFDEIREFLQSLSHIGFNIKMVTFDGWQSLDSIQILKKAGINAEILSVDRNTQAYDTLKEQIYKGLFDIYKHPIFIRECEELIRKSNGKVDHPDLSYRRSMMEGRKEGSKDVSDAAAGCTKLCIEHSKNTFSVGFASFKGTGNFGTGPSEKDRDKLVRYGERP